MWPQGYPYQPQPGNPLAGGFFAGGSSMFPGSPVGPPAQNFAGALGLNGPSGMAVNMAIQPLVQSYLGPRYVPGLGGSSINFYDQMLRRSQQLEQQQAGRFGAKIDEQTYYDYIRSASLMAGQPFGEKEQKQARGMAQDFGKIAPVIAGIAPDFFDQALGARGSAQLFSQQLYAGGRYATDPITGTRGFTGDTTKAYTEEIYNRLYGPTADVRRMRGVGAGQAGILFDEMQRRGLMQGPLDREDSLAQVAKDSKTTVEDAVKLPDFGDKVRKFEAGRAAQQIREMSQAVGAMRELFGDAGRPDAPMSELINAIQGLTQNGLGNMAPREVERLIRQAGNVARNAGSDIKGLMQLTATVSPLTDRLGMGRDSAVQASIGGMAFADAFGRTAGGLKVQGVMGKDEAAVLGATLETTAAASPQFQRLAAVQRLVEEYKVDGKGDSDFARLYRAIKEGKTTYKAADGTEKSVFVESGTDEGSFLDLAKKAGIDQTLAGNVSANPFANEKTAVSLAGKLGREAQREEIKNNIINPTFAATFNLAAREGQMGGADPARREKLLSAAAAAAGQMFDSRDIEEQAGLFDRDNLPRMDKAFDKLQARTEAELAKAGVKLNAKEKKELNDTLRQSMDNSQLEAQSRLTAYGKEPGSQLLNAITSNNRKVLDSTRDAKDEANAQEMVQSRLADLSRGSPLRQTFEALRTAGPDTKFEDIVAAPLGFVRAEDRDKLLTGALKELQEQTALVNTDPFTLRKKVETLKKSDKPEDKVELKKIEAQYGKSADELVKASDQQIKTAGYAKIAGWIDQNMDRLKAETDQLGKNVPAGALDKPAADENGKAKPADALKIKDKDREEVSGLRTRYALSSVFLQEADQTINDLAKKVGGRDKLAEEIIPDGDERLKYRQLEGDSRGYRSYLNAATQKAEKARLAGEPADKQKSLDDEVENARKNAMAAEAAAKDYLDASGLSKDRLLDDKKDSKLTKEEQRKYRSSRETQKQEADNVRAMRRKASDIAKDYGGDVAGVLKDKPEGSGGLRQVDAEKFNYGDQRNVPKAAGPDKPIEAVITKDIKIVGDLTVDLQTGKGKLIGTGGTGKP